MGPLVDYQFLGKTGVRVSRLALGTMSFGGDADEAEAGKMFRRARDAGINFFDCADVYAKGRAEEILGRLIAYCRDEVVVSTKAYFPTSKDQNARGSSRYHLVRAVEASLRRLRTDRVDLFFLHRFDDITPLEETLRGVELLVQQGKVLYPAVSNFAAWQTARALGVAERFGWAPITATQPVDSLVKRQAEVKSAARACRAAGGVPYSPLAGGLLSGKYGLERRPQAGRIIDNAMYATRYGDRENLRIAEAFGELARELGRHPAALAVAWVASHPAVTAPILGARNLEQLEPVLAAAEISLEPELRARISLLSATPPPATDRNEETSDANYGAR
jgi:aryl-alcohol dehydrogenase-like predicted oxidoreductase